MQRPDIVSVVNTQLGTMHPDCKGAAISGVRMDVSKAYAGIPLLLQQFINNNDSSAWTKISAKIDYIYANLDDALAGLDQETGFGSEAQSQIRSGKKLLFKPNLINPICINPVNHGEGLGVAACTEWPFVAALMRLLHDRLAISYYQMALGEASSFTFVYADFFSKLAGREITPEAVIEGRSAAFYGGWGFYFVRKYLAERHPASHTDNPLNGYEDSIAGKYIPPGRAGARLMVYDLNQIQDDPSKGRTVAVPGGANFPKITIHKVIIGGNPYDPDDVADYPGCVLVNVPKLKIHAQDLITCALKNLGIGLYPAECADQDATWKYAYPTQANPNLKGKLPHSPWIIEMDDDTHLPVKNDNGEYIATKTAGMPGTQADIIKAVQSKNVFMLHVADAIHIINISHDTAAAVKVPEGYVWASKDCVALDLFCARYCFKTIPMFEAQKLKEKNGWPTEFVRRVPVAQVYGTKNIISKSGFDSPLFRYGLYRYAEERGVGQQQYHVLGRDNLTKTPLVSLQGHLGRIEAGAFLELMTKTLYYNSLIVIHDLQRSILSYAEAYDQIAGSSLYQEIMERFDENHDGRIDYDEKGPSGDTAPFGMLAYADYLAVAEDYGTLKGGFIQSTVFTKYADRKWNPQGHDFTRELRMQQIAAEAYQLSRFETVSSDRFIPGMTFGKGMWPSWQTAAYIQTTKVIYGAQSPGEISLGSLYGLAFQYADKVQNNGVYTGSVDQSVSDPGSINNYFEAITKGAVPLEFTLYVPVGYGSLEDVKTPNVTETNDPEETFTVRFKNVAW